MECTNCERGVANRDICKVCQGTCRVIEPELMAEVVEVKKVVKRKK